MISPQDTAQLIKEDRTVLFDIRSIDEIVAEYIPEPLFLPSDIVNKTRVEELGASGKTPLCGSSCSLQQQKKRG